jgi:hypothetical protein
MSSNNDTNKKLLFNNLEEYQGEVERLEEIINNQAKIINQQEIIISQFRDTKTGLRKGEIIPLIMGARSYPKTFPMYGSPLYEYMRRNTPMVMELGLYQSIENRMESLVSGLKAVGKTDINFSNSLDEISRLTDYKGDTPIKELLLKQSKGQFLTKEEKDRCIKHAEKIRKNRKK